MKRRSVQINGRRRDNARMSLLKNPSPPASPAGFGSPDPHVGSLYPGIGTTASFDELTNSKSTSVESRFPPENRFTPTHQPVGAKQVEDEYSPVNGALQFVPAFEESNKPTWDAIIQEEKKDEAMTARQVVNKNNKKPTDAATSVSAASRRGPRMARLASLFSSRAVVRSHHHEASSPVRRQQVIARSRSSDHKPPASPAQSSSSGGYVGWPGTQDKRGVTLAVNSSYDDSSAGPGLRKPYEEQLKEEAEREMSRWTGSTKRTSDDFSSVGSFASTPERGVRMRIQGGQGDNDDDDEYEASPADAADFHMAAVADPNVAARSPMAARIASRYAQSDVGDQRPTVPRRTAALASTRKNLFPSQSPSGDSWRSYPPSSPGGTTLSKTSSAYMDIKDDLAYPDFDKGAYNPYGQRSSRDAPARVARQSSPQAPTKEALAANNQITPPHRSFSTPGYRGLIDKTKDVPSLMDAVDSDSMSSSKATSTYSSSNAGAPTNSKYAAARREAVGDAESDVFDGLSVSKESDVFDNLSNFDKSSPRKAPRSKTSYPERIAEEEADDEPSQEDFKVVLLGGGLTTIQTTQDYFSNRQTASDYDENLTNSEVDQYGFTKTPGFTEMLSAGKSRDSSLLGIQGNIGSRSAAREDLTESESGSSLFSDPYAVSVSLGVDGDLSEYYIPPRAMKKVLRMYRRLSQQVNTDLTLAEFEREEDENKAFALFEMRSRIMEKDIERGLERQGGTVIVDDLVTTPYNRAAHRVRDAVIVSKAWRDGANPGDVINTALLTRRDECAFFIKRPIRSQTRTSESASVISGYSTTSQRYYWEAVKWIDDTDFMQYRCPSLGPRHMRGFEIFTIGDCQSILLKLTNERCIELKKELNDATKRQIEAEELMKEEGDDGDGMMTEAEETYLTAMEEVKTVSKKLVIAEKAFALVKDRIEKLVSKYESLLVKIETESFAGVSSIITYESSYYSDSEYWEEEDNREREMWARRAKRAEVRAEIAAREALLAKQEARMIREEKQRELEALQQRLEELQSESSPAVSEAMLAKSFAMRRNDSPSPVPPEETQRINKEKIDGVKQRFRDRMAAKKKQPATPSPVMSRGSRYGRYQQFATPSPEKSARDELFRSAGEEMFQHLDFYERSLKAVESTRSS